MLKPLGLRHPKLSDSINAEQDDELPASPLPRASLSVTSRIGSRDVRRANGAGT